MKRRKFPLYKAAFESASSLPLSSSLMGWEAGTIELAPLAMALVISLRVKGKKTFSGFLNLEAKSTLIDLSDMGPQDHLCFILSHIILGLLCFREFLCLALKFPLLGLNLFKSDGQLLLSLRKMEVLLLGLLLGPSRAASILFLLLSSSANLRTRSLLLLSSSASRDPTCFLFLKLGLGVVQPFFSHISYLDFLYKQKRTKDRVSER